ncbi:MAG: O-antigen ligase family protein [Patescibacteria group bacterium]
MDRNTLKPVIYTGLFLVPFIPFLVSSEFFFPFITTKAFVWRIIVEIIFAAWVLLARNHPEYRPRKSVILYALASFLAIVGLSDLFGVAPIKSFWSNYERMEGFISLIHLGMFFLIIGSVFKEADWKRWWNTSLAASALMIFYCLFQLLGAVQIHQGGVRVDGTLGNASYLAVYMLFHIFIAAFFMLREKKDTTLKWIYGTLILLQMFILYETATRGAILGLLGGLALVALLNVRNRENRVMERASIAVLVALIVVVSWFYLSRNSSFVQNSPVLERFANISTEELKQGGRSFVWPMAIKGFKERPILGWGQDNFNYVFDEHYDPRMYMLEPWFDRAHNIFLDWMVASGILGILSYLSLYIALLYSTWRKAGFSYSEKSILSGLLAAYFFHNFFVFDQLISYILFATLLSYVHSRTEVSLVKTVPAIKSGEPSPLAAALVLGSLAVSMYWINIKPIIANTSLINALVHAQGSPEDQILSIADFKRAHGESRLGRPEVVEQVVTATPGLISGTLSVEEKNDFYSFANNAIVGQAEDLSTDARYQLIAGVFHTQTGSLDEAVKYLTRAKELIPGKPQVYIELARVYYAKGDKNKAIETLRFVSEIVPELAPQMEEYIRQIQNN